MESVNNIIPEKTIHAALGETLVPLMTGYTKMLSKTINSPVIFLYPQKNNINEYIFIEDGLEIDAKMNPLCKLFRTDENLKNCKSCSENLCNKHDLCMISKFNSYFPDGKKPDEWEEIEIPDDKNIKCYKYTCHMELIEYFIPITIDEKFIGAFLTGQCTSKDFDINIFIDRWCEKYTDSGLKCDENFKEMKRKEIETKLTDTYIRNEYIYNEDSENIFNKYIHEISNYQGTINKLYQQVKEQSKVKIRNTILDIAWGKNTKPANGGIPSGNTNNLDLWEKLTHRFEKIDNNFIEALKKIIEEFKNIDNIIFKNFVVFKPYNDINDEKNVPNQLPGQDITDERTIKNYYIRDIKALHELMDNEDIKFNGELRSWNKKIETETDLIYIDYVDKSIGEKLNSGEIIVYYMKDLESQSIAYYYEFASGVLIEEYDELLKEVLQNLSTIFLAQWNGVYSEYNGLFCKVANNYMDHEFAQIFAAMDTSNRIFADVKDKTGYMSLEDITSVFPRLPRKVEVFFRSAERYYTDITAFTHMASSVISGAFIQNIEAKLEKEYFNPYAKIIYPLCATYKKELQEEYKQINIVDDFNNELKGKSGEDLYIHADSKKLTQAINNIIRNAVKYSHLFTRIFVKVNSEAINGKQICIFEITNFGVPISKNDVKTIFKLGIRGHNTVEYEGEMSGIGYGLYIARKFAQQHGGDLILETNEDICEYNIPMLDVYQTLEEFDGFDNNIKENCIRLSKELKKSSDIIKYGNLFDYVVFENPNKYKFKKIDFEKEKSDDNTKYNPQLEKYYIDRITQHTAKICFKLWIPIE